MVLALLHAILYTLKAIIDEKWSTNGANTVRLLACLCNDDVKSIIFPIFYSKICICIVDVDPMSMLYLCVYYVIYTVTPSCLKSTPHLYSICVYTL